ncbi:MAG: DUF58 domain-containing protein [Deltaproteobacteria bacterium]|nr:DUF58 domain-containing protein [Candidatus Anaeroferrophillacea bacterium]
MAARTPGTITGLRNRLMAWLTRREHPTDRPVELTNRRIYIVPTRAGLLAAATLPLIFIAAVNYGSSLAFALAFLLAGIGTGAMWQTHRNLAGLIVHPGSGPAVFAGNTAAVTIVIDNRAQRPRPAIGIRTVAATSRFRSIAARGTTAVALPLAAPRRGRRPIGCITLFTTFPLGLFHAWSWIEFTTGIMVYPRPLALEIPPTADPDTAAGCRRTATAATGDDEFAGLRPWRRGDPARRIAWKAAARNEELLTREFEADQAPPVILDWNDLPPEMTTETRLSVLCGAVLAAEREQRTYALRIPGREYPADRGPEHRRRCLRSLALFQEAGNNS